MPRVISALKALRDLGVAPLALNALYRLGLQTGWYRHAAPRRLPPNSLPLGDATRNLGGAKEVGFSLASREQVLPAIGNDGFRSLFAEADEIVAGKVRLFGAEPVKMPLAFDQSLRHWSDYESHPDLLSSFHFPYDDIKFIWEPARFGFAFGLGRAYHLTSDERYAASFWRHFETFTDANPPYLGPNWMSGQEVALRLMAFSWAAQIFAASPESTPGRMSALAAAVAAHAERIPPTLLYARSQNNNHLLTEVAGVYTASLALPEHPKADKWRTLGIKWLNWCFENQIDETGEYIQHSTNYQRLMLSIALWAIAVTAKRRRREEIENLGAFGPLWLSPRARGNLAHATRRLIALTDPETGHVPNLGANDGAYIFPLSSLPFADFRPILQAASLAFCGAPAFPSGPWDETGLWLSCDQTPDAHQQTEAADPPGILRSPESWVYLRAVRLASRPSHADQLHLDLWWRGLNIALDPGTYLYNAARPWDNSLTSALVHNTVTVDGLDQMTRAGKFLYVDWAQATILEQGPDHLAAEHDGYRHLGVTHRRTVVSSSAGWQVTDELRSTGARSHTYRLHWLLLDTNWKLDPRAGKTILTMDTTRGPFVLTIDKVSTPNVDVTLVRAGEYVYGSGLADPSRGWASPTYGVKLPALSLAVEVESAGGVSFSSEFRLATGP